MTQVWIYAVAASSDPDHVQCVVPWRVDDSLIFFGPCKKRIRELLREQYLQRSGHCTVTDDLFIVGINGSNHVRSRKIVWTGQVTNVMTFSEAYRVMQDDRFRSLRQHPSSPLHVEPFVVDGQLAGYTHCSDEHSKDNAWVFDLVSKLNHRVRLEGHTLRLLQGTMWDSFDRDCCMLLRNFFFAQGQGITFDSDSLLSGAEYSDISKVLRGPFGVCLPAQRLSLYCAFLNR